MKLDEAMTDLSIQREVKRRLGKDHEAKSIGLGIEALKETKRLRKFRAWFLRRLLPGETEGEK